MKILIVLLLLIGSVSVYARDKREARKPGQQYDFSPRFKLTRPYEYSTRRLPKNIYGKAAPGIDLDTNNRMPIVRHHLYSSNMPILVPDSSIHYHMQIKKISEGKYPLTQYLSKKK